MATSTDRQLNSLMPSRPDACINAPPISAPITPTATV
jgi:hypothetical protein